MLLIQRVGLGGAKAPAQVVVHVRNTDGLGRDGLQQLEPLRGQVVVEVGHPGDVAAGSTEAHREAADDRIGDDRHDDRNRRRRFLGRTRDHGRERHQHVDAQADQLGDQCRRSLGIAALGGSSLEDQILPLDEAVVREHLEKCRHEPLALGRSPSGCKADVADLPDLLGHLRAGGEVCGSDAARERGDDDASIGHRASPSLIAQCLHRLDAAGAPARVTSNMRITARANPGEQGDAVRY